MITTEKRCPKCGETKSTTLFYTHKSSKDGYYTYCKRCNTAICKEYQRTPKGQKAKAKADAAYAATEAGRQARINNRRKYNRSEKGKQKNKEWQSKYNETEKGKEVRAKTG